MDPKILNIGDTVDHPVSGVVEGFYKSYPIVGGSAHGNVVRTDGAKFGVGGSLALPTALQVPEEPISPVRSLYGATGSASMPTTKIQPSRAVESPGAMPVTTPESPKTPEPVVPVVIPSPAEKAEPAPAGSGLEVKPPASMEGTTVVPAEPIKAPESSHSAPGTPPEVTPADPSQAVVGEPLVAPAKSERKKAVDKSAE